MPVYLIVDVQVRDPEAYEEYKAGVPAFIRKHGGKCLARGGKCEVLEGKWNPSRLILFRFPDRASVRAFLEDPGYQPLKAIRHAVADTDMVLVEGL